MRYLSVCSGIEAASAAWRPLGWETVGFSEIEAFPNAVLAHHYPDVPNLGDMTKYEEWPDVGPIDVLVGGTPCQSFSVAGLRGGLADARGNLALVFCRLVDALRPRWLVWENVPGVLSSTSHDAPDPVPPPSPLDLGRDGQEVETRDEYDAEEVHAFNCFLAALSELGYEWAYRILDAQYAGLAQRRKRVFVVAHLGDWRGPAAVLLERAGLRGDPPPRHEAGQTVAPCVRGGTDSGSNEPGDKVAAPIVGGTDGSGGYRNDADTADNLIASTVRSRANRSGAERGDGSDNLVSHALVAKGGSGYMDPTAETFVPYRKVGRAQTDEDDETWDEAEVANTLNAFDVGERDTHAVVGTLRNHPRAGSNSLGAIAFHNRQDPDISGDVSHPLGAKDNGLGVMASGVRRLTPRECERLMGFPDDYTAVPRNGKPAADGPRYRALGNSMAVPVVRWIGKRIAEIDDMLEANRG